MQYSRLDLHRPSFEQGGYLGFLGGFRRQSAPDRAIRIARAAGFPLKIAAKVDKVDEDYFRNGTAVIDGPGVEFVGEINERGKRNSSARSWPARRVPVDWPYAFGRGDDRSHGVRHTGASIPRGSVPEVIEDGVTGKLVDSEEEAIAALPAILSYNRRAVRHRFEKDLPPQEWPKIMPTSTANC